MKITAILFTSLTLLGLIESFPYRFSSEEDDYSRVTFVRPVGGGSGGGRGGNGGVGRHAQKRIRLNGGFRSVQVPTAGWPGSRRIVLLSSPDSNERGSFIPLRNKFARPEPQLVRVVLTPDSHSNSGPQETNIGLPELLALLLGFGRGTPQPSSQLGNNNERVNDDGSYKNDRHGGKGNLPSEDKDRYNGSPGRERERIYGGSNNERNSNNRRPQKIGYTPNNASDRRRPNKVSSQENVRDRISAPDNASDRRRHNKVPNQQHVRDRTSGPGNVSDRRRQNKVPGQGNIRDRTSATEREWQDEDFGFGGSKNAERIQDQGDYLYDYEDIFSDPYDTQPASDYENEDQWFNPGNPQFDETVPSSYALNRPNHSPDDSHRQGNVQNSNRKDKNNPRSTTAENYKPRRPNFDMQGHEDNRKCYPNCRNVAQSQDTPMNPESINPGRRNHYVPRENSNNDGNQNNIKVRKPYEGNSPGSGLPQSTPVRNRGRPNSDGSYPNEYTDGSQVGNNYEPSTNLREGIRDNLRKKVNPIRNRNKFSVPESNEHDPQNSRPTAFGNNRQLDTQEPEEAQFKRNSNTRHTPVSTIESGVDHRNDINSPGSGLPQSTPVRNRGRPNSDGSNPNEYTDSAGVGNDYEPSKNLREGNRDDLAKKLSTVRNRNKFNVPESNERDSENSRPTALGNNRQLNTQEPEETQFESNTNTGHTPVSNNESGVDHRNDPTILSTDRLQNKNIMAEQPEDNSHNIAKPIDDAADFGIDAINSNPTSGEKARENDEPQNERNKGALDEPTTRELPKDNFENTGHLAESPPRRNIPHRDMAVTDEKTEMDEENATPETNNFEHKENNRKIGNAGDNAEDEIDVLTPKTQIRRPVAEREHNSGSINPIDLVNNDNENKLIKRITSENHENTQEIRTPTEEQVVVQDNHKQEISNEDPTTPSHVDTDEQPPKDVSVSGLDEDTKSNR